MGPSFASFLASGGAISVSYVGNAESGSDLTTYTFSSQSIGAAAADRVVIVGVDGENFNNAGRTISGVTIGGVSASQLVQSASAGSGATEVVGLFALLVTSGTTADIVVTFSGAMSRASIGVWKKTGNTSAAASDTDSAVTNQNRSVSIDVPASGAWVAIGGSSHGSGPTNTWTPGGEDFDATYAEASTSTYTGAHENLPGGETGKTVGVNASVAVTSSRAALAVATFGP